MANQVKIDFLAALQERFGKTKKLPYSLSLFEIGDGLCRVYVRYSKVHSRNQTFYGIRKADLKALDGFNAVVVFLWDNQAEPLFLPYFEFDEVFSALTPSSDGQIKAQIYPNPDATELYISNVGRFNVESFMGWDYLDSIVDRNKLTNLPELTHSQVQTLLGSIGNKKGYSVWIPSHDRSKLDWTLGHQFTCVPDLPECYSSIFPIIKQVDVLWVKPGSSDLAAMFEVEHSTSLYSGLLRFNDLHLTRPELKPKFSIVSDDIRRALFLRQIGRPTFKSSGLSELCNFLEYKDVYGWFQRTLRS